MQKNHSFSVVPDAQIQRSVFSRSHSYKTTFDSGYLIPVYADEVLPGDTFKVRHTAFCRLTTPIVPFIDNLYFDTFYFYVPNRLLWANWPKFCGEQVDPGDSTDYLVPEIAAPTAGHAVGSLYDYFGVPTGINGIKCNALYFRAYNLIWNEWFRDQNLQDSIYKSTADADDTYTNFVLQRRNKRADYFTSCLPWPQKGEGVGIGLSGNADLVNTSADNDWNDYIGTGNLVNVRTNAHTGLYLMQGGESQPYGVIANSSSSPTNLTYGGQLQATNSVTNTLDEFLTNIKADLSGVSGVSINALRQSFQVQRMLERDARGGSRYIEILRSHFGVSCPDYRVQRPEYLGGGSYPILMQPIHQTSETTANSPLGNLSGVGLLAGGNSGFAKSFTEHGLVIGLCNVRADLTYQQGLNRQFSRRTRYDYYWPALAQIGEQAVLNKEIYAQGPTVLDAGVIIDDKVFGYQERYAEYRHHPSLITGKLRSTAATSLDIWHLSQEFSALPLLNSSFIQDDPPVDRVIAVPSEPQFILDMWFDIRAARPLPVYGVPGMIDHF